MTPDPVLREHHRFLDWCDRYAAPAVGLMFAGAVAALFFMGGQ